MGTLEIVVIVFVGLCLFFLVYQFATKGFKGAAFGCKILRTFDKIDMMSIGVRRGHVIIHQLEHKEKDLIGIEVVNTSFTSYDMTALRFERDDAENFIHALQDVIDQIDKENLKDKQAKLFKES